MPAKSPFCHATRPAAAAERRFLSALVVASSRFRRPPLSVVVHVVPGAPRRWWPPRPLEEARTLGSLAGEPVARTPFRCEREAIRAGIASIDV
jgi:hypothetical protein